MSESIYGLKRSHRCAEISANDIGKTVTLMGWAHKRRDLGGLIFVDLRDRSGIMQLVFNNTVSEKAFKKAEGIRNEFVLAITGTITKRDSAAINKNLVTGEIEVMVDELRILSRALTPPIYIEENIDTNEATRLKYRYLDLRRPDMQRNLMIRHHIARVAREYFFDNGFLEIETPMLTRSTPEGARDYLVPSRVQPGKFFALPQSPQQFKQLLMIAGYDRYIQITRCFRDEDLRADRQPEFTQIDLEMAFVNIDDVLEVNEGFIKKAFKEVLNVNIETPIQRITYQEAMDRYGSDKPDLRFGLELVNLSHIFRECDFKVFADIIDKGGSVRAINAKSCAEKFSRREIDSLGEYVKIYRAKGLAWIQVEQNELKSSFTKFLKQEEIDAIIEATNAEPGDLLLFVADKNEIVCDALGHLRQEIAKKLDLVKKDDYKLCWVTEFPLLEYSEEEKRFFAMHHPFTSPMDEDLELLDTDPSRVRAKAYDIVLNGYELGGGSIRIHSNELQTKMFNLLGFTTEQAEQKFGYFLEAFKYGTPPHGGIAYGLDRIAMLFTGSDSIKDVIAFPKVQNSSCLMTQAPSEVDDKQLKELSIKTEL